MHVFPLTCGAIYQSKIVFVGVAVLLPHQTRGDCQIMNILIFDNHLFCQIFLVQIRNIFSTPE